ncbi:MAG: carboxypeptidase-like regulatory domain-containing protein [Flammeovirgaceae bacterium]|nr:carboxypeptidase-like regulatory domain-containing protein [Flammeovirgaceae bacterium]
MKCFFTAVCLFVSILGFTQHNTLTGTITDSETNQPVAFANVFFANTRIGTSSDAAGKFSLRDFPSGKYDLTVTFVGYSTYQQSLEFNDNGFRLEIKLTQKEIRLSEVIVREDTTGWARNFEIFKKHFIGETINARQCKILNPKNIHLYYDTKANVLVAHAREPIQIENQALGFKIDYYLYSFEIDFKSGSLIYVGIPSFQNLTTEKKSGEKHWNKERLRAYKGSMSNFIRMLRADSLLQQGFEVRKYFKIPNPERPSQKILNAKIRTLRSQQEGSEKSKEDSLRYYLNLSSKPELIDSLGKILLTGSEIVNSDHEVEYQGMLKIDYKKEKEEGGYLKVAGRTSVKWQTSIINFKAPKLKLYANGYYEDYRDVFVENYWAWSEKMADTLPLDYQPETVKKKTR